MERTKTRYNFTQPWRSKPPQQTLINHSEVWLFIQIPSIPSGHHLLPALPFPRLCSSPFSKTHAQHRFTPALTWALYSHSKISAPCCSGINLEVGRLPDPDTLGLQTSASGTTRAGVAGCKGTSGITPVSDLNIPSLGSLGQPSV